MTWSEMSQDLTTWFGTWWVNLSWSLVFILIYVLVTRLALPKIQIIVSKSKLKAEATQNAYNMVRLLCGIVTIAILLIVWGVDFSGLLLLSTSLITLTGVAMFASWSMLSNITSYFILLFHPTFQRGNFVRILEMDNYIEGYIADVNLFNIKLITEDRDIIVYPNNMVLARPTIVNPRNRWRVIGKITDRDLVNEVSQSVDDESAKESVKN